MKMEDLALQIEECVENAYEKRHGDEYGRLQAQVFKIMNESGTEMSFQEPVTYRFNPGDTVVMEIQGQISEEVQKRDFSEQDIQNVRKTLRFDLNDRVLCYCGPRWFSGHVVGTAVPDDGDLLPYLVKTDAIPGLPSRTISVPQDKEDICMQEVCFDPVAQMHLMRSAASVVTEKRPSLRFALGDKIVCRIRNNPEDGLENWVPGLISDIWPSIGEASWDMGEVAGKFPDVVPYKITLASGKSIYCHKDDHTLVRREGMQPTTRVKGISKRMEYIKAADGSKTCVDHVTGRRKRMLEDSDSD